MIAAAATPPERPLLPLKPASGWPGSRRQLREARPPAPQTAIVVDVDDLSMVVNRCPQLSNQPLVRGAIAAGGAATIWAFGTRPAWRNLREAQQTCRLQAAHRVALRQAGPPPEMSTASAWHKCRAAALQEARRLGRTATVLCGVHAGAFLGTLGMGIAMLLSIDPLQGVAALALLGNSILAASVGAIVLYSLGSAAVAWQAQRHLQRSQADLQAERRRLAQRQQQPQAAGATPPLNRSEALVLPRLEALMAHAAAAQGSRTLACLAMAVAAPWTICLSAWGLVLMLPAIVGQMRADLQLRLHATSSLPPYQQLHLGSKRLLLQDLGSSIDLAAMLLPLQAAAQARPWWWQRQLQDAWHSWQGLPPARPGRAAAARLSAFWSAYTARRRFWGNSRAALLRHKAQTSAHRASYSAQLQAQEGMLAAMPRPQPEQDAANLVALVRGLELGPAVAALLLPHKRYANLVDPTCSADGQSLDLDHLLDRIEAAAPTDTSLYLVVEQALLGEGLAEARGCRNAQAGLLAARLAAAAKPAR